MHAHLTYHSPSCCIQIFNIILCSFLSHWNNHSYYNHLTATTITTVISLRSIFRTEYRNSPFKSRTCVPPILPLKIWWGQVNMHCQQIFPGSGPKIRLLPIQRDCLWFTVHFHFAVTIYLHTKVKISHFLPCNTFGHFFRLQSGAWKWFPFVWYQRIHFIIWSKVH